MNNIIVFTLACFTASFLIGCGDSAEDSFIEDVEELENLSCINECSSLTLSFDNKKTTLFSTPSELLDLTNATLNTVIYQDGNYTFSTTSDQITDENANLQSTSTSITFGYFSFPDIDTRYGVVDPAYVYYNRNNNVPYIKEVSFNIVTNDGLSFSGSVLSGVILEARVMAPIEFWGDEISDFNFKLLTASVTESSADVKYQLSFNFESNGILHTFEQTVDIKNDSVIAAIIPSADN